MIEIVDYNKINKEEWKNLVESSSVSSFFQSEKCYDFFSTLSFLKPFVFGVTENKKLTALVCGYEIADGNILKRKLSRRAIIPGGILLSENVTIEAVKALLKILPKETSKAIYIEFRNYNDYSSYKNIFKECGFEYKEHLNFHVDTASLEQANKNLSSTKRRDVKLSLKEGAEIVDTSDKNEIKQFYSILKDLYETRIKTPLFPLEFFEKIVSTKSGKIFAIKYNENVIGGSLCVFAANNALYEWFVCGEDRKYKNIFPSTLATWAAIEFAAKNNFEKFDMMGAGKPDEGYGVRDFKSKFGGELVEHGRFLYINKPIFYSIGKKAVEFLKGKNK